MQIQAVLAVAIAYLLGSIDFGAILPRLVGVDIYSEGSGNPGASNVMRTMGRKWGALVMAGDLAKGVSAAAIGAVWVGSATGFACMFGAVVGHCYPVWHRFRGGRGVATAEGAVLWLEPVLGGLMAVGWLGVLAVGRVASVASLVVVVAMVPALAAFGHTGWSLAWAGAAAALIVYRHKPNIQRLLRGGEHRVESP